MRTTRKDRLELYRKTIDRWGQRAQLEMMQEEATELALATRKFIRNNNQETLTALISEIADVEIMIEQIVSMFAEIDIEIIKEKDRKIDRLLNKFD